MSIFTKWMTLLFSLVVFSLTGCGSGDQPFYDTGDVPADAIDSDDVSVPAKVTIKTSSTTISSDSSITATITATVLDSDNVVVPGATVNFASDGGELSPGTVITDASGEAQVTLSAGADPTNQTILVTASSSGVSDALVPVDVIGSTVTITPTRTNLVLGGEDTATLKIKAADSSGIGIYNTAVAVSIDATATTGVANLSSFSGLTNTQGEWSIDLTGTVAGTVRVVATALGASSFEDFTVESAVGSLLITSPATGSTSAIGTATHFSIYVPNGVTAVTLVSSMGTWSNVDAGGSGAGTGIVTWSGLVAPVTVGADLTSNLIGTSTIKVANTDNTATSDTIQLLFVDETVDGSSTVSMQASPTTVQPSLGGTLNSSLLTARVNNGLGQPIAGARVTFSMSNTTGSGEYIDPPVAYSDASGIATSTFYSGSQSTDVTGLVVTATLDDALTGSPAPSSAVNVIVGGTAGAIAIGTSTSISSINSDTAYQLPMSVQVTDSGGNPVAFTPVSLSLWPQEYALGFWVCEDLYRETVLANEDVNRSLNLELGEDLSGDGTLTPAISAAGSIPTLVETDANGVATFDLVYLKDYAGFINNALSATAWVQGTETRATLRFQLPALKGDIKDCLLGESPLNAHWPGLSSSAELDSVLSGGGTNILVTLKDSNGVALVGKTVAATFILEGTFDLTHPTLDAANPSTSAVTDASGKVIFAYLAGDKVGSDVVKISYLTPSNVQITNYVTVAAQ